MADIRPFRGWHYTGDVSRFIAPPYDILDAADKAALLEKSPDNIVSVDLPHVPPKELGPAEVYKQAAVRFQAMADNGTLTRDDAPALYAYSQSYEWAGRTCTRRAMICGVRATEFFEDVWPHEQTFAGPKADRLKLTEETGVQMSPIFGFYDDRGGAGEMLWQAAGASEPIATGELNGVREQLWAVSDPAVVDGIRQALADARVFIADGHHRYTTALNYRNQLHQAGAIDDDHEANFVMFTLVAMDDPGLLVLPTHRMFSDLTDDYDCDKLLAETEGDVEWLHVDIADELLDKPDVFLQPFGRHAMAFLDSSLHSAFVAVVKDDELMRRLAPDACDAWRDLDVAILEKAFIERCIAPHMPECAHPSYSAHGREVVQALKAGRCQMAVILQGTPLAAVRDVSLSRAFMPHKSTYFYPKLATGMVMKPLL